MPAPQPCNYWAENMNISTNTFGVTMGGEWSLASTSFSSLTFHSSPSQLTSLARAVNDCGKWINNVGNGYRYDGTYYVPGNTTAPAFKSVGSCDPWNVSRACVSCLCATLARVGAPSSRA